MLSFFKYGNLSRQVGLRLVALGLLFVGLGLALPRIPQFAARLPQNGIDFVRGLCFGFALAVEIAGVGAAIRGRKGN